MNYAHQDHQFVTGSGGDAHYGPATISKTAQSSVSRPVSVRLEKLAAGRWRVSDADGSRGGLFRDYTSAMQFIRHEFAVSQPTVVEMLLA